MVCNDKHCSIVIHIVVREEFLIYYLWYNDNTYIVSVFQCTSIMWWFCLYEAKHGDAFTAKYNVQTITSTTDLMCRPIAWRNVLRWLMKNWCLVDNITTAWWRHFISDFLATVWVIWWKEWEPAGHDEVWID